MTRLFIRTPVWFTLVLGTGAFVVASAVLARHGAGSSGSSHADDVRAIPDSVDILEGARFIGNPGAPILVTVFVDYQCPFSAEADKHLGRLIQDLPESVAIVYRHYPLRSHRFAMAAAMAAECARDQGRFQAYHKSLFEHADSIGVIPWSLLASRAGIPDTRRFEACLLQEWPRARVEADLAIARAIGVLGTPTYVVNGLAFAGTWTPGRLREMVLSAAAFNARGPAKGAHSP